MLSDQECFYTQGLKADGSPFKYSMINYTGIAGGVGPTGSVLSKNKTVSIPRSKKAETIHTIGFSIKLIFFIALLILLIMGVVDFPSPYINFFSSLLFLLIGGGFVAFLYKITKVRSKLFQSPNYPLIVKLEEKGYSRGGHVMISSTPLGTFVYISRWLF